MMGFTQEIKHLIIGLDTGQKVDRTVLAVMEKIQEYGHDPFEGKNEVGKPFYKLSYIERFPLDVPTPQQTDRVKTIYSRVFKKYNEGAPKGKPELKPTLIIDLGNVGRAHFDEYQQEGLHVYGVNYLGDGAKTSQDGNVYGVSKKDLASALAILLENDRLHIPDQIQNRAEIIKELSKFTWKQTPSGGITAENLRSSDHDDIVSSLMVAAWYGEHGIREIYTFSRKGLGI